MASRTKTLVTAALVAAGVGACGAGSNSQQLSAYIHAVNPIEHQMIKPLATVSNAGTGFVNNEKLLTETGSAAIAKAQQLESELAAAHIQLVARRDELVAVPSTSADTLLRRQLLNFTNGEIAMASELRQMVSFLPAFGRALTPVAVATAGLQKTLSKQVAAGTSAAGVTAALALKAKALTAYQQTLTTALDAVAGLTPPQVSRSQYKAQTVAMRAMRSAAGSLAIALTKKQSQIDAALQRFDRAAVASDSTAIQKAEIAAIDAFDNRVTALADLDAELQYETQLIIDGDKLPTGATTTRTGTTSTGRQTSSNAARRTATRTGTATTG